MLQGICSQINGLYPLIGLAIFAFVFKAIMFILTKKRKNKHRWNYSGFNQPNKLEIVSKAEFTKSNLMNKSEYALFTQLANLLDSNHKRQNFQLFSQVSMGEFVQSNDHNAFKLINSKRVDFLIIDQYCKPIIVIEYQGSGHYQNNAIERDSIKKECCRKAKIEYIEFSTNYDELDFQRVSKILNDNSHNVINNEETYAKYNSNQLAKSR
ncbi:Protein of uncharacterised function (DUF2726) [Pasteurella multocida]|nr:Protein of uncharacterised function (DUF2726) [Pasteurella multocida]